MVAKLITTSSTGEKTEFELVNETTTIGRKPGNDIPIDNLSVSGRHAQVITILEDSFLEDLGSTNGTYVNGSKILATIDASNGVVHVVDDVFLPPAEE